MFFDSWDALLRMLIVGVLAYAALVACLRISGKRTLAKMNAFDLIVTVALGSTLATILLNRDVSLAQGVLAYVLLIGLQFTVAWFSTRSDRVQSLVKSEPALLVHRGRLLVEALRRERLTREEVFAAVRSQGFAELEGVEAVILETDGSFSVIPRDDSSPSRGIVGLQVPPEPDPTEA